MRGEGRAKRILQVLLDPGRVLTTAEFRILKAAASLMAAILELEEFAEAPLDIAASAQSVA